MDDLWQEINDEYNKARSALWCNKSAGTWHRDEDSGLYHLWNAYHKAKEASEKNPIVYARILAMMATEANVHMSEYNKYTKFVKPSMEAFRTSVKSGLRPSTKELDLITEMAESMQYKFRCEKAPFEEMIVHIEGYEKLGGFQFHDSKPIHFEHDETTAKLSLQFEEIVVFRFDDVLNIEMQGDPATDYVSYFCCYPCFHNAEILTFDVDLYKILCSSISVESVKRLN